MPSLFYVSVVRQVHAWYEPTVHLPNVLNESIEPRSALSRSSYRDLRAKQSRRHWASTGRGHQRSVLQAIRATIRYVTPRPSANVNIKRKIDPRRRGRMSVALVIPHILRLPVLIMQQTTWVEGAIGRRRRKPVGPLGGRRRRRGPLDHASSGLRATR